MSFLRKGILVVGAQGMVMFMSLVAGIVYARSLGPNGLGQYRLCMSTALIIVQISTLGIGSACVYLLNNRKLPIALVTTNAVKWSCVLGLPLAAVMTLAYLGLPGYFGILSAPVVIVFALGYAMLPAISFLQNILTAQLAVRRMSAVKLLRSGAALSGGLALALLGWLTVDAALLIVAASLFCSLLLVVWFLRPHIDLSIPFDWKVFRQAIAFGIKMSAANLLYLLSLEMSVMLLRLLTNEGFDDIAFYTRATAVCQLALMVPLTLGPLLFAKWAGVTGQDRTRQVEMATRINVLYSAAMAGVLMLLGGYLIRLMYGVSYVVAAEALVYLAPTTIVLSVFMICTNVLAGDGRAMITTWILAGNVLILVVAGYLLVPGLGFVGMAISSLISNTFSAVVGFLICRRLYGLSFWRCLLIRRSDWTYILQSLRSNKAAEGVVHE